MTAKRSARRGLGLLGLSLILTFGTAQAAPNRSTAQPAHRRAAARMGGASLAPRRVTLGQYSTDSATSRQHWSNLVRTEAPQIPALTRENYGPFGVWQNRRFERGETPVPPSVHIF
jgi:hypothetical protein